VISNTRTGKIECLVPLKRHPRPRHRRGWRVLLQMSLDALFNRTSRDR
jgi:hypothetical protein